MANGAKQAAQTLGRRGGQAAIRKLTPLQRSAKAQHASLKRWQVQNNDQAVRSSDSKTADQRKEAEWKTEHLLQRRLGKK